MIRRALPVLAASLLGLAGCGQDTAMTKKDFDLMKNPPPMTASDRQRMADGMAAGQAAAKRQESAWAAKQDPAQLAKINADRAAMGRPPLGG